MVCVRMSNDPAPSDPLPGQPQQNHSLNPKGNENILSAGLRSDLSESNAGPSGMIRRDFLRTLGIAALGSGLYRGRASTAPAQTDAPCSGSASEQPNGVSSLPAGAGPGVFVVDSDPFEGKIPSIQDEVSEAIDCIETRYDRRGAIDGLPSGFKNLDQLTNGLHAAEMIVIAGRLGMGTTAFALNIADHVALNARHPVAIFSLELTAQQIVQRMICSRARVNSQKVRDGFLTERDFPRLTLAASKLAESQIYIDDTASLSIEALRVKAIHLKRLHDVRLVIIDHLQLLRSAHRRTQDSRREELAGISSQIKALAKELEIPIIALAQLNRRLETRQGGRPRLGDLRQSSSIEPHADFVGLLVRPEYYAEDKDTQERLHGEAELIIAKQRNGPVGEVRLKFWKEFARFEDRASGIV